MNLSKKSVFATVTGKRMALVGTQNAFVPLSIITNKTVILKRWAAEEERHKIVTRMLITFTGKDLHSLLLSLI